MKKYFVSTRSVSEILERSLLILIVDNTLNNFL